MQFEVTADNEKIKKYLEMITTSVLKELKLTRSRKTLLIMLGDDAEHMGSTVKLGDIIFVALNSNQTLFELGKTLAHELVHVKQFALGLLRHGKRGVTFWRGVKFGAKTPYLQRPWELQAFAKQEILLRLALEE